MDITFFVDEYPPFFRGGLGTYAMEITRQFVSMGHRVTVFSRNTGDDPTRSLWDGIEVHRPLLANITDILPIIVPEDVKKWPLKSQKFFAETFLYNILSYSKLVNDLVRKHGRKPDVLVSHDWLAAPAGILAKEGLKKPFVFHVHSTEHGRVGDGSQTVKEIESKAGKKADRIVTVSYAMRDELISLGYEEKKIRVVYNGVDPEKYNPERFSRGEIEEFRKTLGIEEDEVFVFFIGRLTWVKGADTLIQAMPLILREFKDVKLVVLGRGDQEEMLKHMVANLGLQDNVILVLKYVSEEERALYYAACDIGVFPSKYEPFGIVATEAMSMGKPVVVGARGTSGMREQVIPSGPDRCGSHVNPYDPRDIAKFVLEMMQDDGFRERLGRNARKRVLDSFTWERAARETLRVYERILQQSKSL